MVRWFALVAFVVATIWFAFFDTGWLDRRPVERILFIGHSLTYNNRMPEMVEKMADSAVSDVRFDIVMQALPGGSLEKHWNNAQTRQRLAEGNWDRVLIHPESWHQPLQSGHEHFSYGAQLFEQAGGARRVVVTTWTGNDADYEDAPLSRADHFHNIEINMRALANRTGADLIDVAQVWNDVSSQPLPFSLYRRDGHHPSLEGSYLAALVICAELTRSDIANVTWVPWRMSGEHAALLRERVRRSLQAHRMAGFADQGQGGPAVAR